MDRANVSAKFEVRIALPVPGIIGSTQKMGSLCVRPCSLFSKNFNGLLFKLTLQMQRP